MKDEKNGFFQKMKNYLHLKIKKIHVEKKCIIMIKLSRPIHLYIYTFLKSF